MQCRETKEMYSAVAAFCAALAGRQWPLTCRRSDERVNKDITRRQNQLGILRFRTADKRPFSKRKQEGDLSLGLKCNHPRQPGRSIGRISKRKNQRLNIPESVCRKQ